MTTTTEATLRAAAAHAIDWLRGLDHRPVAASRSLEQLRERLDGPLPETPTDPESVIDQLVADTEGGLIA